MSTAAPRFGEETLNLKLGGFLSEFDTEVAVTGPNGGTGIDLEEVLGLDSDQTSFRGELMWRFAPRHRVILGYYRFDRSATTVLEGAIEIDDPAYLKVSNSAMQGYTSAEIAAVSREKRPSWHLL